MIYVECRKESPTYKITFTTKSAGHSVDSGKIGSYILLRFSGPDYHVIAKVFKNHKEIAEFMFLLSVPGNPIANNAILGIMKGDVHGETAKTIVYLAMNEIIDNLSWFKEYFPEIYEQWQFEKTEFVLKG
jgi:hypothetical protein